MLLSRSAVGITVLLLVLALSLAAVALPASAQTDDAQTEEGQVYLIASQRQLQALPTEGPAWEHLVAVANQPLVPDLADQNNFSDTAAFAAGLVYARTGDAAYRTKVEQALALLPGTEAGGRTLSLGRQLAGWVLAADLVGYRDPAFISWLDGVRTAEIGGHGRWTNLTQTHENTASNWGTFAGASRIVASLYLGDSADVARAAQIFRGWTGDRQAWPGLPSGQRDGGFQVTADFDDSWACAPDAWSPVNPAGCGQRDGALVEDISRSATSHPTAPDGTGLSYSWEALQGATLQALVLSRHGYPDVWQWSDGALRRAVSYLAANRGFDDQNFHRVNHWVPWIVDAAYGTSYASVPAGHGRQFGFADWLAPAVVPAALTATPPTPDTRVSSIVIER